MESPQPRVIQSKIALTIKVAAILVIVLAIYFQDLTLIANEALNSEIMSYILAIPILFTYLLYRKRKVIRAAISFDALETNQKPSAQSDQTTGAVLHKKRPAHIHQIMGALICLTAFILYWHGSYTFYPLEYHMLSMPIFIAGIILVIFNTKTLTALAFPIALMTFLTPPPQEILSAIGSALSILSSETAYTISKAIGLPVTLSAQYGTPVILLARPDSVQIAFTIDTACAGFYSLIGFIVFATFIAHITKGKLPKKATIFLIGIPLMLALNIARITLIVLIGNQYGEETALQAFHLLGGWVLILTGSIILSTIAEKIFKINIFTSKKELQSCNYCNPNPNSKQQFCSACGRLLNLPKASLTRPDLGKILVLVVCAILILNIQVPVFVLTEGPVKLNIRTLRGEETVTKMLPQVSNYTAVFVYRDKAFEEQSEQDASLIYAYSPNDTTKKTIWTVIELAKTRASMHPWEVCLITWQIAHGYQPQVTQLTQRDTTLLDNPPIIARFFAFQDLKTNMIQVILYWYESSYFNLGSSMEREYTKISFLAYANNADEIPSIENQLIPFGKAMVEHWLPIKSWSLLTLLMSQNGLTLMAITTALLALTLAYQTNKSQKRNILNLKAYDKLTSEQEKLILQAVDKTAAEDTKPTGHAIAQTYQKLAGKSIDIETLRDDISRANEAGFLRRDLANQDDEPILIWRTQTPFKPSRLQNLIRRISNLSYKKPADK
jgi:exosortase